MSASRKGDGSTYLGWSKGGPFFIEYKKESQNLFFSPIHE